MDTTPSAEQLNSDLDDHLEHRIFLKYYTEKDYFLSPEGILKVLSADIIISAVMGVLLLITAVLSMTVCEFTSIISYMHGPLAVINAGMVTASAVITYVSAMRLWDAARPPREPPRPPPPEQDV
ncbi:uncharacterized protein LOC113505331 [Trichoplusia ni]|uniref:Uncharacterized protein LOC113505331 n=1 Tax=Trichoplusia ni TaxID=7111 RepID=A0A7E5WSK5_TRINI|nr:uncharacterized protein LOC113505331 [Trichoplusia ni]